jgi:DNA invertase Pin-like site-specific DNA recombinase
MERRLIGERTKAALAHKRSKSEKTGGDIPFGYDLAQGILVKNDEEQGVIRIIRRLHGQGLSLRGICTELESEGHKTKRGNDKWHPETIAHIIRRGS